MSKLPAFNICTIIATKDETKSDKFLEIGAAWWSKSGGALNLVFDAMPVGSNRVVLVPNRPKDSTVED